MPRTTAKSKTQTNRSASSGRSGSATSRSSAGSRSKSATGSKAGATRAKSSTAAKTSRQTSKVTTDHEEIRNWAEERGAHPACVKGTGRGSKDTGMIRLDFPGFSGEDKLQPITWEEFFKSFDENQLALVYQEKTARGQRSNFNKLVKRDAE